MLSPSRRTRALDNEIQARDRQIVLNFRRHLKDLGRSRSTISLLMATARHFSFWLTANELNFDAINARIANRFHNHDCQCPSPHGLSRGWARHRNYTVVALFRYLVETGHVPLASAVESDIELVERFLSWLLAPGYSPATVHEYRSCCFSNKNNTRHRNLVQAGATPGVFKAMVGSFTRHRACRRRCDFPASTP